MSYILIYYSCMHYYRLDVVLANLQVYSLLEFMTQYYNWCLKSRKFPCIGIIPWPIIIAINIIERCGFYLVLPCILYSDFSYSKC